MEIRSTRFLFVGLLAACSAPTVADHDAHVATGHDAASLEDASADVGTIHTDAALDDAATTIGCVDTDPVGDIANDGFESFDDDVTPTGSPGGIEWTDSHFTRVSADRARRGTRALRFTYSASPNPPGSDTVVEQRFGFDRQLTDFWLKYDIFIPANYFHRSTDGTNEFGGGEKELVMMSDGYSAPSPTEIYPTLILGRVFRRIDASDPTWVNDGSSWQSGSFSYAGADGERTWDYLPSTGIESMPPIIDVDVDPGTWVRRILHVRMPSTESSGDGVIEYWATRCDGTTIKIVDEHEGSFHGALHPNSAGGNYITAGYLLGSSNTGFDEETTFYIDDVVVSSTNLWGVE